MATIEEMNRVEEFSIQRLSKDIIVVTARDKHIVHGIVVKNSIVTGFIDGADYSWFSNGSVLGYGYHPFDLRIMKPTA